jgi:hypothetical protein
MAGEIRHDLVRSEEGELTAAPGPQLGGKSKGHAEPTWGGLESYNCHGGDPQSSSIFASCFFAWA